MSFTRDALLPTRLNPDAILEALVELRFETDELPEAIVGRLVDIPQWKAYAQARLPLAELPQTLRDADANLRHQPTLELRRGDGLRAVKLGSRVVSYHVTTPYPGWEVFREEIGGVLRDVAARITDIRYVRVGLRYINVFHPEKHGVRGVSDTTLAISVAGEPIETSLSLNYMRADGAHAITVRVATPDVIAGAGALLPGFSLLVDLELATVADPDLGCVEDVAGWIERAHELEKSAFFRLLPEHVLARLADHQT